MQQVRMDRVNTFIKVSGGGIGWATYQWDFSGTVDGQPMTSRGHTTLVLEKRNDQWLIVHNHTSLVQPPASDTVQPAPPAPTPQSGAPQPQSGKPPAN
jgi:ketosteroid isomerase-like protein